jgi:hypothetical protein
MSSLSTHQERILRYWDKLVSCWEQSSELWNDNSKILYEKMFWKEYVTTSRSFFKQLDSVTKLLERMKEEVK